MNQQPSIPQRPARELPPAGGKPLQQKMEGAVLPPNVNIFNHKNSSVSPTDTVLASACPARRISAGQALVAYCAGQETLPRRAKAAQAPAYEPPRVEMTEVACEAGYAVSLSGWEETEDLGGGEMTL